MTVITSSVGESRDVDLDIDRIIEYESTHPDWSILDMLGDMGRMRFSDLDSLARFVGFEGIKDMTSQGFSIKDLSEVFKGSKLLGFTEQD